MATKDQDKSSPPYLSYKTLLAYINGLQQGVPQRIDASTMRNLSGQTGGLVRAALKYLRLVDTDGTPGAELKELVQAEGSERQRCLRQILERAYPFLLTDVSFDLSLASDAQFRQQFKSAGLSGDTQRKAESFFLAAAKDAGIGVSPYIDNARKPGPQSGAQRPRVSGRRRTGANKDEENKSRFEVAHGGEGSPGSDEQVSPRDMLLRGLVRSLPSDGESWTAEQREQWFESCQAIVKMLIPVRQEPQVEDPDNNS